MREARRESGNQMAWELSARNKRAARGMDGCISGSTLYDTVGFALLATRLLRLDSLRGEKSWAR